MEVINEGSAAFLQVVRRDSNGDLAPPVSLEWRIDNLTWRRPVREWTAIDQPSSPQEIPLPGELHEIVGRRNSYEDRQVVVRVDSGLPTQEVQTYTYRVKNIQGVE